MFESWGALKRGEACTLDTVETVHLKRTFTPPM